MQSNRTLIASQEKLLANIQAQGDLWIIFFTVSILCIIFVSIFVYFLTTGPSPDLIRFAVGGIGVTGCIWLSWTMRFALTTVNNQRIIYQLLTDINNDIEAIRNDITNYKIRKD